jgi:hypothetical protein
MTIRRYSIQITLKIGGDVIFNGTFNVDALTNVLTGFYEDGSSTNLLVGVDPGTYNNVVVSPIVYLSKTFGINDLGFKFGYSEETSTNLLNNNTITLGKGKYTVNNIEYNTNGWSYDNAYKPGWFQFDQYGVMISSMSYFKNTATISYSALKLSSQDDIQSTTIGLADTSNIGTIEYSTSATSEINAFPDTLLEVKYNIKFLDAAKVNVGMSTMNTGLHVVNLNT